MAGRGEEAFKKISNASVDSFCAKTGNHYAKTVKNRTICIVTVKKFKFCMGEN